MRWPLKRPFPHNLKVITMTQEPMALRSGTVVPDPLDLARAQDDHSDALHRLAIVQRALGAEHLRLHQDDNADRAAILEAWRINADLLAETMASAEASAETLRRLVLDAAKALNAQT